MTTFAGPQPSTLLWVAPSGNNATAMRGRIDKPFLTINAALAAAVAGDTLLLAPGTYNENVVMPDKDGIAIVGTSTTTTIITAALGHTLAWTPAAGPGALVRSFRLSNLTIDNTDPASDAIRVDGSAVISPNTFLLNWFNENVIVTKTAGGWAMNVTCVGRVINTLTVFDATTGATGVRVRNVGRFGASECSFSALNVATPLSALDVAWERAAAAPVPGTGREGYYLANSSFVATNVVIAGQPIFSLDRTSTIAGTVTATALTYFLATAQGPVLNLQGQLGVLLDPTPIPNLGFLAYGGTLTVTLPDTSPTAGVRQLVNLAGGKFYGTLTFSKSAGARATIDARGATIYPTAAASISSGNLIDLDLRGASFTQAALASTGASPGTVDRDTHTITGIASQTVSTAVPAFVPFPAGVSYVVSPEVNSAAVAAATTIVSKAAGTFNFISANAGATLGFTLNRVR